MRVLNVFSAISFSIFASLAMSCSNNDGENFEDENNTSLQMIEVSTKSGEEGITTFAISNICPIFDATDPLTASEIEFLYAMREDEKVAKDVYSVFAQQYPLYIQISNVAIAEANHILTIENIFNYYEIIFPSLTEPGVFENSEHQAKYDRLIEASTALDAFITMAQLEEENVASYRQVLANADNVNIQRLLENMIRASSNHLKIAVAQIKILGGVYTPNFLDQASFDTIINSTFNQGNKYNQQNGVGGNGANTNSQKGGKQQGQKGSVDKTGTCTASSNGVGSAANSGKGNVGKGYRGGR